MAIEHSAKNLAGEATPYHLSKVSEPPALHSGNRRVRYGEREAESNLSRIPRH